MTSAPAAPPSRPAPTAAVLLAALTAAGLVLRLALWHTQPFISVDGTAYVRVARWLAGGPEFASTLSLGYPLLIVAGKLLAGDWVRAARGVDLVLGTALIPLTGLLARRVVETRWLRLAPPALVAFLPLPVFCSLTTATEAPYVALLVGMFVLVLAERPFRGGLLGGLAFAVRPEALVTVGALAVFRARRPRTALWFLGGAVLVVGLYAAGGGLATGRWTLLRRSQPTPGEWWQARPMPGEEQASYALLREADRPGEGNAASFPNRLGGLAGQLLGQGGYVLPLLSVVGLSGPGFPLLAALLPLLLVPWASPAGPARLVLPYLPFLWVLAASGLERLRPAPLRWVLGMLCLGGIVGTGVVQRSAYAPREDGDFPELVETGKWLEQIVEPGTIVYDRNPLAAFYAGATYRTIPLGSYEEILDEIVAEGGDYLVVDQAVAEVFRPALLPLVTDKAVAWAEPRLRPVYVNPNHEGRMTILFRVVRPGGPPPLPFEADPREHRKLLAPLEHQSNHFRHGLLYMRAGNLPVAAGEFALAVRQDSTNAAALNNQAWCLAQTGKQLAWAERSARKAVELDPGNVDYLDTLEQTLRAAGKTKEAERVAARIDSLESAARGDSLAAPGKGGR